MSTAYPTDADRRRELAQLVRLALSLSFVHVGYHLTGFVDTALAGRAGGLTLAATGLGSGLFFAVSVFGIGAVMGLDPLVAQALGAGRDDEAVRSLWQGLYVSLLVTLPLTLVLLLVGAHLEEFGIAPELGAETRAYLHARLPSMWPLLASVALRAYLQAAHTTRPIVLAVVGVNVFNLVADWLLLFGDEGLVAIGLPRVGLEPMGVRGLGWASTLAAVAQLVILGLATRLRAASVTGREAWRLQPRLLGRVLGLGTPVGLQLLAETGFFALVGLLMGRIGQGAMAAHQVALQLASMTFAVVLGVGSATSVQVGRQVGRGDTVAARRAGLDGMRVGAAFMLVMGATMLLMPRELARVLTSDPRVLGAAAGLVSIAAVFQVADGVQAVGSGALRGLGITRWTFAANLAGHWLVGAPVGLSLAFGAGMGPTGLWWGLTAGLATVAVALAAKFLTVTRRPVSALVQRGPD